jgi:hypothetical protein
MSGLETVIREVQKIVKASFRGILRWTSLCKDWKIPSNDDGLATRQTCTPTREQ